MLAVGVVGVLRGQVAQRRLRLDVHEVLVIVDLEDGVEGVDDPPDHHRRDLDRIAVGVVDLEVRGFEVAHPQGDRALGHEGVRPAQTAAALAAAIGAEQGEDPPLVRLDHEEPGEQENRRQDSDKAAHDPAGLASADPQNHRRHATRERPQQQQEHHQAVSRRRLPFFHFALLG